MTKITEFSHTGPVFRFSAEQLTRKGAKPHLALIGKNPDHPGYDEVNKYHKSLNHSYISLFYYSLQTSKIEL